MSRRWLLTLLVALIPLSSTVTAQEQVFFDPETRTGTIDADLVAGQLVWTSEGIEAEAAGIGFVLAEERRFTGVCGEQTIQITDRADYVLDHAEQRADDGSLDAFELGDPGRAIGQDAPPVAGESCADGQVWANVVAEDPQDRLYLAYRGYQILLWPGSGPGILRTPIDERQEIPPA